MQLHVSVLHKVHEHLVIFFNSVTVYKTICKYGEVLSTYEDPLEDQ
jgi:hypothetical protein